MPFRAIRGIQTEIRLETSETPSESLIRWGRFIFTNSLASGEHYSVAFIKEKEISGFFTSRHNEKDPLAAIGCSDKIFLSPTLNGEYAMTSDAAIKRFLPTSQEDLDSLLEVIALWSTEKKAHDFALGGKDSSNHF